LEEELETTLNFLKRTTTFITKLILEVKVILDLEEEVEIGPQPIVEEQLQLVFASRLVEEEELQQPIVKE
jgi:hypothetical protein